MMMLDSSLGKILSTTKPVEPSIPESSSAPETKDDSVAAATKAEAEVRIVFRLFVEEHIVFNGKIEQIKQLDSEELSRTVSRIAWDGGKDKKQPMLVNGCAEDEVIMDIVGDRTQERNCHIADDPIRPPDALTDTSPQEKSYDALSDNNSTPEANQDRSLGRTEPIKSTEPITTGTPSSERSTPIETSCEDVETTHSHSHNYHEADSLQDSSQNVQEEDNCRKPTFEENQSQQEDKSMEIELSSPRQSLDEVDNSAENRMIVEALNDCVDRVDLECRQSDLALATNNELQIEGKIQEKVDVFSDVERDRRNSQAVDMNKEVAKADKKPLAEAANVPLNQDITKETISPSEDSCSGDKSAHSRQTCKDDLNLRANSSKKSDVVLTSRRRNTYDTTVAPTTTNRRIRRSGSKDLRTSRALSTSENTELNIATPELYHTNRHFAQQTKVFAKWSDNHFYPGTILRSAKDRKFEIGFFDGARKEVVETDLIPLSNIHCKQVRVSIAKDYCVNAIVHEQLSNNGQHSFDVSYQQNGLVRRFVPLCDIFLTAEQGIPLINQPLKPDKNPDESMFAGVDLDNIVHNKRSRRLQDMEDLEMSEVPAPPSNVSSVSSGRRKRSQYNTRTSTNRARAGNTKLDIPSDKGLKRSHSDVNDRDTPASSCSPDNIKPHLHLSTSNPPSESSSSMGSSNSTTNGQDIGQDFYFESSPHRTKTSLLS